MNKEDYLHNFKIIIQAKYPGSLRTHTTYISIFKRFLRDFNKDIKRATTSELSEYIASLPSESLMRQMYGVLKNFYTYVLKQPNKIKFVPFAKKSKKLPYVPTDSEIKRVIHSISSIKHRCIVMILYGTGIRVNELIQLTWADIKRTNNEINPLSLHIHGKGKKDRIVPLSKKIYEELIKYCNQHKLGCETSKSDYIFGFGEKPYSKRSVAEIVKKYAEKSKIGKHLTPHLLRHACFTYLREKGIDIATIQELAGHEHISTTMIYARLNPKKIEMPM